MSIVLRLLSEFNDNDIKYCVFKEHDLIMKTIDGHEDIDILVDRKNYQKATNIMKQIGYRKCIWPKPKDGICFYLGYDKDGMVKSLLHIHTKLRIGTKEAKELHWIELEDRIINNSILDDKYDFKIIKPEDEICLLFIRMILRKNPNADDYLRLEELSRSFDINLVPMGSTVKEMINICKQQGDKNIELYAYINAETFGTDMERKCIRRHLKKPIIEKIKSCKRLIEGRLHRYWSGLRRRLKLPSYPIRHKGYIYALVGVDGSGKSTIINEIINDDYIKLIGLKRIYGGSNEYWLPGLQKLAESIGLEGNKRRIVGILCLLDRRIRVIKALVLTLTGCNVVFDRYSYDLLIGYKMNGDKNDSFIKQSRRKLLYGWIGHKPKCTFFMDIDADIAFSRKQEYSFEKLCENIEAYREEMIPREEVIVIDASDTIPNIKKQIINVIAIGKPWNSKEAKIVL